MNLHPVDIIVPVYKGISETKFCLESVWQSCNTHSYRLIVINDCSPDIDLTKWLRQLSVDRPEIVLIENEINQGFVSSVNIGMGFSESSDVILLNSDTEVFNDWLDRLAAHAYSSGAGAHSIATVTPFSNNAAICSYPFFCKDNKIPVGWSAKELDSIFSDSNKFKCIDIPTAVGFCMYIRRDALVDIGFFDEKNFGKGYGEENDFSMRASDMGWRNVQALDVFVLHRGSVSFGESRPERVKVALNVLCKLHPNYDFLVNDFINKDPAGPARCRADLLRINKSEKPVVLLVNHQRGGGTERHCEELRNYLPQIEWMMLKPSIDGRVELTWYSEGENLNLSFDLVNQWDGLIKVLAFMRVQKVHFHHWLGFDSIVLNIAKDLSVPQDFTFHDYYGICPQITLTDKNDAYCGETGLSQCAQCLQARPAGNNISIDDWRGLSADFFSNCERLIFPTLDVYQRFSRYFPVLNKEMCSRLIVSPHPDFELKNYPDPVFKINNGVVRIAIIGALSKIKGADLLEAVAVEAYKQGLSLEFKLFGFAYRSLKESPNMIITGEYRNSELREMLLEWEPTLAWFPAQCPETYSYTLSSCLENSIPVVSTSLGGIPERIKGRQFSWVLDWKTTPDEWCQWFSNLYKGNIEYAPQTENFYDLCDRGVSHGFYVKNYSDGLDFNVLHDQSFSGFPLEIENFISSANKIKLNRRARLISVLYWLRSQPLLRWFSRKIPSNLQRRVKSFILGERS
ncbi:MAG: glycosyltransferase [Halothiobacillaceae bacterium]|nr:glycosyltransferase [Halothiobacillaceae bacterium]